METKNLPVAIIGAGPIGLAAAAHLLKRGQTPLVFEAGRTVGAAVLQWGHVRLFSPWRELLDREAAALLAAESWQAPDPAAYPTGRELVESYLAPLANTARFKPHLRLGTRVVAVSRQGIDKMKTPGREESPFVLRLQTARGEEQEEQDVLVRAVIDASGTYGTPNPLGASGIPALGERALREHIFYGIPDILRAQRERYADRRVLVVGSGHSAFNALLELAELAREHPATRLLWAIRRTDLGQLFGGGKRDALPARGALGQRMQELVESGQVRLVSGVRISALYERPVTGSSSREKSSAWARSMRSSPPRVSDRISRCCGSCAWRSMRAWRARSGWLPSSTRMCIAVAPSRRMAWTNSPTPKRTSTSWG